ncbi:hypothetical protein BDV95DRAFT_559901 [Massariosphaeria phaeospora]|uniref:Uncharacterized protein n=1 Tax=Massariosphaeria phaeospora TaxID=100035 RepID=A0A7C8MGI3_9PLEO|nr:hypothetical protein BDV95DRAFT_559901 [Massariosphaeria phaeospora]
MRTGASGILGLGFCSATREPARSGSGASRRRLHAGSRCFAGSETRYASARHRQKSQIHRERKPRWTRTRAMRFLQVLGETGPRHCDPTTSRDFHSSILGRPNASAGWKSHKALLDEAISTHEKPTHTQLSADVQVMVYSRLSFKILRMRQNTRDGPRLLLWIDAQSYHTEAIRTCHVDASRDQVCGVSLWQCNPL